MSLIINIDTAADTASVCLAKDNEAMQISFSENQQEHASWLHTAIAELLKKNGYNINDLQAVAVSIGPGSYTGLRIGLAAAKGICYALNVPLIAVGTLEIMAFAVKKETAGFICPVIDARRMEVFTALYNNNLEEKIPPASMIIDDKSFSTLLSSANLLFCGSGIKKLQTVITNSNAIFSSTPSNASHLAELAFHRFQKKIFADLAYIEPLYIKEFFSPANKNPF